MGDGLEFEVKVRVFTVRVRELGLESHTVPWLFCRTQIKYYYFQI